PHPLFAAVKGNQALLDRHAVPLSGECSTGCCVSGQSQPFPGQKTDPDGTAAASRDPTILQEGIGPGQVQVGPLHPDLTVQRIQCKIGGHFEALRCNGCEDEGGQEEFFRAEGKCRRKSQVQGSGAVAPCEPGYLSLPETGVVSCRQGQAADAPCNSGVTGEPGFEQRQI